MKFDFKFCNPTQIYFGKTALDYMPAELAKYGKTVMLIYGKGSIKKMGLYDKVIKILADAGKTVIEYPGIKSNPTYNQMMEGARIVRENNVDLILAVGGGSTIDSAKAISVAAYCEEDPWEKYFIKAEPVSNKAVPVASILTMVGTGSEMNFGAVITNEEKMLKVGRVFSSDIGPKFSILNPEFTYSVPQYQMASGIFDAFSHLLEQYFSGDDENVTDYMIEGILKCLIDSAKIAMVNPTDYEARGNIMWAATLALNYITQLSKEEDWEVHFIEHQLGAYTDCAHGAGLAIISPAYYRYIAKYGLKRFARFAKNVWDVDTSNMTLEEAAEAGIVKMEEFIAMLKLPTTLREVGTTEEMLPLIAESTTKAGGYKVLDTNDVLTVLKNCF